MPALALVAPALVLAGVCWLVAVLVRSRSAGALWAARTIAVVANLAAAGYLTWRAGFTVNTEVAYLGVPLLVAEVYWLVVSGLLTYTCWSPPRRDRAPKLPGRQVAVLIATYNEDPDVLRPTVLGALAIEYDAPVQVCVCDDGDRAWVREMCAELGATYICRPAPRRHAKAGNLNHALRAIDAEFVVTLDADHVPVPHLLREMLGYFEDPRMGLVQAPQSFYNRGFGHPRAEADPLRNDQTLFFDVLMPGKDRHGAAFWCGCPSVLRRAALLDVGGVATTTVVEDSHTAMLMHARGWRSRYVAAPMAYGLAPEEITAFSVQRGRWALGMLQVLRRDPPMTKRGLSVAQRIEYTSNCLHFLEVIPRLVGMLVPVAVLILGLYPISADPALYWALFLPQLVLVPLASWALTGGRYRPIESERYAVIRMEAYLRALSGLVSGRGAAFKVTPKGARAGSAARDALTAMRLPLVLAGAGVAAVAYQAAAQWADLPGRLHVMAALITSAWALANACFVLVALRFAHQVQHRRAAHRFPVRLHALMDGPDGAGPAVMIEDLSVRGARVVSAGATIARGERLTLTAFLDDVQVTLPGRVAGVRPGAHGTWVIGVAFERMPPETTDLILRWCFRNPFGADTPPAPAPREAVPAGALEQVRLAHAQLAPVRTPAPAPPERRMAPRLAGRLAGILRPR